MITMGNSYDAEFLNLSEERVDAFWEAFDEALEQTRRLVAARGAEGRNNFLPIVAMWPYGAESHRQILWQKMLRFMGNVQAGNGPKTVEELEDIVAYSLFAIADLKTRHIKPGVTYVKE